MFSFLSELRPIFNALRRSKAGALMLLFQIAITTAIVSNAAFIIQERMTYLNQDTGYPEHEIFYFSFRSFAEDINFNQRYELDEQILRDIPGVIDATSVSAVPLSGSGSNSGFSTAPLNEDGIETHAAYIFSDEHILDTLGVKVSQGREFTAEDVIVTEDFNVLPNIAIVSKDFMDILFPDGDGLGKTFYSEDSPVKIVGVVDNLSGPWLRASNAKNVILFPYMNAQSYSKLMVRTHPSERAAVMSQIEEIMLQADNERVIRQPEGLNIAKDDYNASDTLMLRMLLVLIVVLVAVTALGNFGLTMFNINKRTKQIGTRRAIGARKSDIVRYFLLENTLVCFAGLVLGSVGAISLAKQLMQMYSLPALDYGYVAYTTGFVLLISLLAVIVPAMRAANISPSIATRTI